MEQVRKKQTGEPGNSGEFGRSRGEADVQLSASALEPVGVRIGELSEALGIPIKTLRRLADQKGIPSNRSPGGHRVFDLNEVRAALGGTIPEATIVPTGKPDWEGSFALEGLDESVVWAEVSSAVGLDAGSEGNIIARYGFTEMLNNAVDHSLGTKATVEVWSSDQELAFRIADNGEGVFAHLRIGLGLDRDIEAAGELTKGKRTTWRERHSGEGIFFTSKAGGAFRISSNGFRMTVDNTRADFALGSSAVVSGSIVEMNVPLPPPRTLRSIFDSFTDEDQRFSKSRPAVKLFGSGVTFVSRSEARRVMDGMTGFAEIDIDFAGVEDVGQGFIDEVLRVWPSMNAGIRVHPINMSEPVEFMVRRSLASQ
ncbi:MerR family DNA-binding transcriptional regulator [Cryobacterium sp. Sr8]|uniref:MerR family DNA-binding transcriptional regulator n=1 Tax=Cryobacterium sp. Sr8 TaxID=1259203 RepID=UPI00106BCAD7|nr:MerR family DNA-binding transcriptional regulator [Cryobacterium sp. Sr8]TFD75437.1 MerR family DNA-binding transcriptional regulator [Cryobacterium sp. Sr8]